MICWALLSNTFNRFNIETVSGLVPRTILTSIVGFCWFVPTGAGGYPIHTGSAAPDVSAASQARDFPFHGRRPEPCGFLRPQAGVVSQSRQGLRLHRCPLRDVWQKEQAKADDHTSNVLAGILKEDIGTNLPPNPIPLEKKPLKEIEGNVRRFSELGNNFGRTRK